jgi:hypothetical protein
MPTHETYEYVTFDVKVRLNELEIEHLRMVKQQMGLLRAIKTLRFKVDIPINEARDYIESL